jgi:hypothetical protein
MAKTGESYTAARRRVITDFQAAGGNEPAGGPERFAISYDDMGPISTWADTLLGGGPAGGPVAVGIIQVAGMIYSRFPIASTGRVRSACRVGTDRATRASSAETPRIAANQPAYA